MKSAFHEFFQFVPSLTLLFILDIRAKGLAKLLESVDGVFPTLLCFGSSDAFEQLLEAQNGNLHQRAQGEQNDIVLGFEVLGSDVHDGIVRSFSGCQFMTSQSIFSIVLVTIVIRIMRSFAAGHVRTAVLARFPVLFVAMSAGAALENIVLAVFYRVFELLCGLELTWHRSKDLQCSGKAPNGNLPAL